jgi:hypothetical protein
VCVNPEIFSRVIKWSIDWSLPCGLESAADFADPDILLISLDVVLLCLAS